MRTRPAPPAHATAMGAGGVLAAAALWGTVGPAQVLADSAAHPAALAAARLLGGGLVLALTSGLPAMVRAARSAAGAPRGPGTARGHRPWVLAAAAATAVFQVSFVSAVHLTGAALATVVALGVAPAATGALSRWWLHQSLPRLWGPAAALAVTGCVLLVAPWRTVGQVSPAGVAASVLAGACYGAYTVAAKRFTPTGSDTSPLPTTALTLLIAGALVTPWALMHPQHLLEPATIALNAWTALAGTALAYAAFVTGLRGISASTAGVLSLAEPLVAVVLGVLLLHEPLTATTAPACLLLATGLTVSVLDERRSTRLSTLPAHQRATRQRPIETTPRRAGQSPPQTPSPQELGKATTPDARREP